MAKAKKTKSGKWTIRVYDYQDENGKQYYKRITRDTKAECELAAAEYRCNGNRNEPQEAPLTVGDACDKYIELCKTLSPTTVHLYQQLRRDGFQELMTVPVTELDDVAIQQAINDESMREGRRGQISPKTLANEWGFVSSSLWHVCKKRFDVRLPKRQRKWKEYPEPQAVADVIQGSSIELPCLLALQMGFRMSEIRGFRWEDIRGDYITVNRVMVDVGSMPTEKEEAKTPASKRTHRIPHRIKELMKAADHTQPYVVPLNHAQIYHRFKRIMDAAGIDITFHDLRHMNTSIMMMLNIPEKYRMERNGWSTPHVMKGAYEHTFTSQRVIVDDTIDAYFDGLFQNMTLQHDSKPETP